MTSFPKTEAKSLWTIFVSCTQNTIDYFALNSGKFGDAVLNNSRLKLLLQMEEPEALKLKEKVGLSDEFY